MTMAFRTTKIFQKIAPATLHPADQTTRPQILERKHNPKYYDLIKEFGKKNWSLQFIKYLLIFMVTQWFAVLMMHFLRLKIQPRRTNSK